MSAAPKSLQPLPSGTQDHDALFEALRTLPPAQLAPARAEQALAAAQAQLAQRFAPRPWLVWYERRLEPGLLAAACALYLAWAAAAARPPVARGEVAAATRVVEVAAVDSAGADLAVVLGRTHRHL